MTECRRNYTREQIIAGLKAGKTFVVDRKDAPELPELVEMEREGLVESEFVEYYEQSSALKFRWKTPPAAFYFGCWEELGHFLHDAQGNTPRDNPTPWSDGLMDSGLLKNGKVPDVPDGRVYWTCAKGNWHAFFWWDRSVDRRGACNSSFYVQGFPLNQAAEAFAFACSVFPKIVARQKFPLRLIKPEERSNR